MNEVLSSYSIDLARTLNDLEGVQVVYRSHKQFLGFLPAGAFQERFEKSNIIVAKAGDEVVGYVLFSINQRSEVRIAHLAVAKSHQGRGVSTRLIERLKTMYSDCSRIRLNCRLDFDAAHVWRKLGFVETRRISGKRIAGSELICFQLRLDDMPLFDASDKLPVVICDANVCIDIHCTDRDQHENSSGLLADWLAGEVSLAVTSEIFEDFARLPEPLRSDMTAVVRSQWRIIEDPANFMVGHYLRLIESVLGTSSNYSFVSDQRHLAIAAATGCTAFATRDQELLDNAFDIYSKTGIRVQRPSEVICEIDSVIRSHLYQFRELKNTGVERYRVSNISELELDQFVKYSRGETDKKLSGFLDGALSQPKRYVVSHLVDSTRKSLALTVAEQSNAKLKSIHYLRIARRLSGTRLGNVMTELLAHQPLGASPSIDESILRLNDLDIDPEILTACLRRGFIQSDAGLWRISLPGFWSYEALLSRLSELVKKHDLATGCAEAVVGLADELRSTMSPVLAAQLEKLIAPGKITFSVLPSYIVPIKPQWAQELFDHRIWNFPLLEMDTKLVLNPDSIYYKRPRNSPKEDCCRILWYISGSASRGGNRITACSLMTKGVRGSVKNLYREYQRMGVYEWKHLMEHFKGNPHANAFALEFTNTELFPNPIRLDKVNEILVQHGMKRQSFPSALKIDAAAFQQIYVQSTRSS